MKLPVRLPRGGSAVPPSSHYRVWIFSRAGTSSESWQQLFPFGSSRQFAGCNANGLLLDVPPDFDSLGRASVLMCKIEGPIRI